jgi:phage terminase small subunit
MASKRGPSGRAAKGLTKQQQAFVAHYVVNHNGAAAYAHAYPSSLKKSAAYRAKKACELLKKGHISGIVSSRADKMAVIAEQEFEITARRVLQELAAIAFANAGDLFEWGERDNVPFVRVKPSAELTRTQLAAIVGADETVSRTGDRMISVRMADKRGALRDLGQHLRLFNQTIEHVGANGGPIENRVNLSVPKPEIPDFASITDKREAVRRFQEFRQQLNERYLPPSWPPKKVDGGQLQ